MRSTRTLQIIGATGLATLALAAPASADRQGVGRVGAPHLVTTHHVAFTLPGDSWAQVVGGLSGTPALGWYAFAPGPQAPSAAGGHLTVRVSAEVRRSRPLRRGTEVIIKPGTSAERMRVDRQGANGPVRWWSGTTGRDQPLALGYQRAPRSLDATGSRWLVYAVSTDLSYPAVTSGDAVAVAAVRRAAATMRLAPGPARPTGPFAGA
jgi:hypothetical protein